MTDKENQEQTRLAVAALAAAFARTIGENDPDFVPRLLLHLKGVSYKVRGTGEARAGTLETLRNVEEFLK
jgi:hypothetical protein